MDDYLAYYRKLLAARAYCCPICGRILANHDPAGSATTLIYVCVVCFNRAVKAAIKD
jgi:hypothetical protein